MKIRFPFFAQIISIIAVQMIVLSALFTLFFSSHCGFGWEPLLYSPIGDRVDQISWVIGHQLQGRPQSSWSSALDVFGKFYGVKFSVFDQEAHQLAGEPVTLPAQVSERLQRRPPTPPVSTDITAVEDVKQLEKELPRPHKGGRFILSTSSPKGFWIGTRLHMRNQTTQALTLIAVSSDLWHTKLFVDFGLLIAAQLGILALSALIWLPFVYRVNKALSQLTQTAERIAEGRFDAQVDVGRWDEIGRLAEAIDSMSKRLNGFVHGQKRFLGDIAHELCSPIARLQVALEIIKSDGSAKQEQALNDIKEDVQEMSALINELLAFSKAGLRGKEMQLVSVQIKPLLTDAIEKTCPPNLVSVEAESDVAVLGDKVLLERALANIFRNAVRYAGECGPINVKVYRAGAEVVISIIDNGPGVPAEALEMLGEPFYRPEPSRSRDSGGVGLGLAIVKTCIDACDGSFKVRNASPKGLEIQIRLKPSTQPAPIAV